MKKLFLIAIATFFVAIGMNVTIAPTCGSEIKDLLDQSSKIDGYRDGPLPSQNSKIETSASCQARWQEAQKEFLGV